MNNLITIHISCQLYRTFCMLYINNPYFAFIHFLSSHWPPNPMSAASFYRDLQFPEIHYISLERSHHSWFHKGLTTGQPVKHSTELTTLLQVNSIHYWINNWICIYCHNIYIKKKKIKKLFQIHINVTFRQYNL